MVDVFMVRVWVTIIAAAVVHINVVGEQLFKILPLVQGNQVIAAHNERELVLRVLLMQVNQGIYSVRRLWQLKLNVR